MNSEVAKLQTELASQDKSVRDWAAVWAGNYGADALELLPALLKMIADKVNDLSPYPRAGEFVSVGRILRDLEIRIAEGHATDEQKAVSRECYSQVLALMQWATGISASLLIYILVLIGPPAAEAAQSVLNVVLRTDDVNIRNRAYQFAYWVKPQLLAEAPWNTFAPIDPAERAKWEVAVE